MEEQIEPALDALRTYKPVTFSYENGTELTVDFHLPGDMRAQYEQRLYDTLMANESYVNAVMNSDEENATLTGERVLREYVADSEDRDFQRTYYDNPRLREALNRVALDAAYHDLSEPPVENEPELDDTPVNIQPRDPMSSAYGVGDFVWFEGSEYQITDLQRGYVELLPPELPIPVYRTERRADFERGLRADERNRYITDYLTAELNDDAHEYVWSVLTPEDRAQISAWLRAGEGNAQIAGRLAEMFAGRDGAEPDGLHYRIPDDAGNIVATGFVPWEQLAGAARGMYREDSWTFEHGSSAERTYNEVKTAHLDSLVLIQDSDVMRAYGDDAVEIAAALGLNVTDGVLSFPVSELREYTDVLRKEHNITIFASDGREQFIAADTPRIAVTDAYIDAALVRWGDLSVKANVSEHIHDMTPGQLAAAYGYAPDRPMHITVTGTDGGVDLSWDEVQERVARLVGSDLFLTKAEKSELNRLRVKTVAYYEAEKTHLPYDVVFQTIGSAPEPDPTQPEPSVSPETPRNFRIMDDQLGEGGAKARFRANMNAVTTPRPSCARSSRAKRNTIRAGSVRTRVCSSTSRPSSRAGKAVATHNGRRFST